MNLHRLIKTHKVTIALFLSIGMLSAIVNFSSFTLLWKVAGLNYQLAVTIAYILSVIVHFTGNRNLTFKSFGGNIPAQIGKYLTMVAINYTITLIVMHLVVEIFHLSPFIGLICSIASTVCNGYLLSKFWVFKLSTRSSR